MGTQVSASGYSAEQRHRFGSRLRSGLAALRQMLAEGALVDAEPTIGTEAELNLVDTESGPAPLGGTVLGTLAGAGVGSELGRHNLELNSPPRPLAGTGIEQLAADLHAGIDQVRAALAGEVDGMGVAPLAIGILPTVRERDLGPEVLCPEPRYATLNAEILAERGGPIRLHIHGSQSYQGLWHSIAPEVCCTSFQLHRSVAPGQLASYWNAAQLLAGPQLAIGANSPYLLGRALWHETRVPLFLQSTDTRDERMVQHGVAPRVWFGRQWLREDCELFAENIALFRPLLPECALQEPWAALHAGEVPELAELRLHNGTVWRWNRPVYDRTPSGAQLRLENRVLPAGPTVADMLANAAFFLGATHSLVTEDPPPWNRLSFADAHVNFLAAARFGSSAVLRWPGRSGRARPRSAIAVVSELLPAAARGLRALGVDSAVAEHYLGIIDRRCAHGRTGAGWQLAEVAGLERAGLDRWQALREMTRRYRALAETGAPVAGWPSASEAGGASSGRGAQIA